MTPSNVSFARIWRGVGYGAAVVAPFLLLLDLQSHFEQDWPDHLWIIDYYGTYFRAHGAVPEFMNPAHAVGMALPVFYGWLLYPALGILAAGIGAALAVRVAVFGLIVIQFCVLLTAGRKIFGQTRMAAVVSISVIWGTYSLTNLYNRGALAEYFATGFVVTAIGFGAVAALAPPGPARRFHGWLAGLFLLLAIGAHPPTAVLAAMFLGLLGLGWAIAHRRGGIKISATDGRHLAGGAVVGAVILAPWVDACARLGSQLIVAKHHVEFAFLPEHCDTFWGRFAPFPYDAASTANGIYSGGTPYLEAPVNVILLGLLLWNLELCRRGASGLTPGNRLARIVVLIATGWFILLAAISISPALAGAFGFFAPSIQYVYRLVSHCNAALLVGVLASGLLVARQGGYRRYEHQTNCVLAVGLAIALVGLGIKLQHAAAVELPGAATPPSVAQQLAVATAYTTQSTVKSLGDEEVGHAPVLFFPGNSTGDHFGEMGSLQVGLQQAAWLRTNAMVFPWLEIRCDGEKLPSAQLARAGQFYAVQLPAGSHLIQPVWRPDPVWSVLHALSHAVVALLVLVLLAWAVVRGRAGRSAAGAT